MLLNQVEITGFRNLASVALDLCPGFNVFYGNNGAGKTSVLEALYYLGMGRSFRSSLASRIIMHSQDKFTIFGLAQNDDGSEKIPIGIERTRTGIGQIRIAGQNIANRAELVQLLPLQLIDPHGYSLVEAGPRFRRLFLDWGMFHVEPSFLSTWRRAHRVLKQRNALLRENPRNLKQQITSWDEEFVVASCELHQQRQQYVDAFMPLVTEILEKFLHQEVVLEYYPGWNIEKELKQLLEDRLTQDVALGYTGIGPQKTDLRIKVNKLPAQDVLSRGQQKLLLCAMQLARGLLIYQQSGKRCIYLLDDLPSELDQGKREIVIAALADMQAQTMITSIQKQEMEGVLSDIPAAMFHVEQGRILAE